MKKLKITAAILFVSVAPVLAQGLVRTPFLELGSKPVLERQTIPDDSGRGYTFFDSNSASFDKEVKAAIQKQKGEGFKKFDKATYILANTRALSSQYPVEAGYTYRIISLFQLMNGTNILRAKDQMGKELAPEVRTSEIGNIFSFRPSQLQLRDIAVSENGSLTLENELMGDKTVYYANVYLIFRKKS